MIKLYESSKDRDSALRRIGSSPNVTNIRNYLVDLGSDELPHRGGSVIAVSQARLLGVTFYMIINNAVDYSGRKRDAEEVLVFIDSILTSCQEK